MPRTARTQHDSTLSTLGLALLGLARAEPRSGYALRKVFETTPIGRFSSSPGSIYPALRNLEARGLVERRSLRPGGRARFHATARGRRVFSRWLESPVAPEDYDRDPDAVLLRFAFLGEEDPAASLRFLASFESAVRANLAALRAFLASDAGRALTRHGVLAVRHGVLVEEAALRWARGASRALRRAAGEKG